MNWVKLDEHIYLDLDTVRFVHLIYVGKKKEEEIEVNFKEDDFLHLRGSNVSQYMETLEKAIEKCMEEKCQQT